MRLPGIDRLGYWILRARSDSINNGNGVRLGRALRPCDFMAIIKGTLLLKLSPLNVLPNEDQRAQSGRRFTARTRSESYLENSAICNELDINAAVRGKGVQVDDNLTSTLLNRAPRIIVVHLVCCHSH